MYFYTGILVQTKVSKSFTFSEIIDDCFLVYATRPDDRKVKDVGC